MIVKYSKILGSLIYVAIFLSVFNCNKNDLPLSDDSSSPIISLNNNMIYGKIFTEDVYPTFFISNAVITLEGDTSQFQMITNDSGKYIIDNIPSGNYLITVTSIDYDTVNKNITLTGIDTIGIDFNLHIQSDFEPGIVLMGIVDSASFRSVFYFADSIGFTLRQMTHFKHTTKLISLDSANQIHNFLLEKPYLNKFGLQPQLTEVGDSAQVIIYNFFNMSSGKFLDWFSAGDSLGISYISVQNKNISIRVPSGEEKYWLNQFKKSKLTRWLALNYYIQPILF
jgi:hypothetical protein